ncbi:orotate phosphoribosyltransferase [Candidatus Peregrinibacteria bacterium CG_4_10_14_0_2_um_filter_38_24]|nr:MAG: orotate phosphoribosyltransferase [Candidatus Peregrinibacteria bacterium CG_4_10_14_0_2_um_filter_38_24]
MQQYKIDFIKLLVKANALKFGQFTLKSGRIAPYFFNAGSFFTGELIHEFAKAYAGAFLDNKIEIDVIFGPAYKGIPLAACTVEVLFSDFEANVGYCFNRKEAKDHGEGNLLVGAPLKEDTRVLLIDDVMTAGTAVRESMDVLKANGNPVVSGILIAMDRMEKNNDGVSAVKFVTEMFNVPVYSIVNLDDVVEVLYGKEVDGVVYIDDEKMELIKKYREQYGA